MDASPSPIPRLLTELTRGQSLRLLASIRFGRIVFTHRALPAIRPVNHVLDGEDIVIRTHPGAAIVADTGSASGVVVAYEADAIDPGTGLGWSVIVTVGLTAASPGQAVEVRSPGPSAGGDGDLCPCPAGAGGATLESGGKDDDERLSGDPSFR